MHTFAKGVIKETLERHIFNARKQEEGEVFYDLLTDLKKLNNCNSSANCINSILHDCIVCRNKRRSSLKETLIRTSVNIRKGRKNMSSKLKSRRWIKYTEDSHQGGLNITGRKFEYILYCINHHQRAIKLVVEALMSVRTDFFVCKFCVWSYQLEVSGVERLRMWWLILHKVLSTLLKTDKKIEFVIKSLYGFFWCNRNVPIPDNMKKLS